MKRALFLSLVLLLLVAPLRGDEVTLTNGAVFRGEILKEGPEALVMRTTAGAKLTLPLRQVANIVRAERSPGARLFEEGRRALKRGEQEAAIRLFEQAAASEDPSAVRAAKDELSRLRGGSSSDPSGSDGRARWTGPDPFGRPEPEAIVRELAAAADQGDEQARQRLTARLYERGTAHMSGKRWLDAALDFEQLVIRGEGRYDARTLAAWRTQACENRLRVAREAIRFRNANLARAAAAPVFESPQTPEPLRASAAYFQGRALELANSRDEAIKAYARTVGQLTPSRRDVETYRELARLATVGIKPGPQSPGVGPEWRSVKTKNFSILHSLGRDDPQLGVLFETWRSESAERLGLTQLKGQDRIQVFLYPSREAYLLSEGARTWSTGHATRLQAAHDESEILRVIYFFRSETEVAVARHEIAHILTWDALGERAELPAWAVEGAAIYAEPADVRSRRKVTAARWRTTLDPTREALARMLFPVVKTDREVGEFYVQAGVNFSVLAEQVGVARAFQIALKINTDGPEGALRSGGLDLRRFELAVEEQLGGELPRAKQNDEAKRE